MSRGLAWGNGLQEPFPIAPMGTLAGFPPLGNVALVDMGSVMLRMICLVYALFNFICSGLVICGYVWGDGLQEPFPIGPMGPMGTRDEPQMIGILLLRLGGSASVVEAMGPRSHLYMK
jgi:hypothetical protein